MIKVITSKENNKLKHAASLLESKYRNEYNEFLSEGSKSLEMALQAGCVKEIFTLKEIKGVRDDIVQYIIKEDLLKKIASSKNPEGIVFVCLKTNRKPKTLNKNIYCENINDPGNLGTIIRTALAFDFDSVIVSKNSCDVYNPKTVAASKGAIFKMPILFEDIDTYLKDKKLIVSALNDKAIDLDKIIKPESFILAVGNESHGVSDELLNKANQIVKISIQNIDSLNVSVAAGILMNHLK